MYLTVNQTDPSKCFWCVNNAVPVAGKQVACVTYIGLTAENEIKGSKAKAP